MRIGMFPLLVLRLVVGSFMLIHSSMMLWSYETFVKDLSLNISNSTMALKELLIMVTSLIPFAEFAIGLMLVFGIFYKRALAICAFLLLAHMVSNFSERSFIDAFFIVISLVTTLVLILSAFTKNNDRDNYFTS